MSTDADRARHLAETAAGALNDVNISLRLAADRIEDVNGAMHRYQAGIRDITDRGIGMQFSGDTENRYSHMRGAREVAERVSDSVRDGQRTLSRAQDELHRGKSGLGVAQGALAELQTIQGHDQNLVQVLSERSAALRHATERGLQAVEFADNKLGEVRHAVGRLDMDGYLHSQMSPGELSERTTDAGRDAMEQLIDARSGTAAGSGRLENVRVAAEHAAAGSAQLAAQKGLNPPSKHTTGAATAPAASAGEQDLRSRISRALDGDARGERS